MAASVDLLLLLGLLVVGATFAWTTLRRRARRQEADTRALNEAIREGRDEAPTLHPVVNADRCIGSLSCIEVCPEGDVLGVVDGKAALVNPSACIGHGKCQVECPMDAIQLVFGSSKRGVDLPDLSEFFETSRAGVHIVGELGGMGLIKNAITQGLQCARYLVSVLPKEAGEVDDVLVVGAGPAGLATALALQEAGKRFTVVDQETLGGTISHYPRQKVVMTERVKLPFYGRFGAARISKEELLEAWQSALGKAGISVQQGVKVEGIQGEDGNFTVTTSRGELRARKVVLAIGRRGTPRKLGVPGEDLEKVAYRLVDPQQYEGTRVLVVGGGDAALEAAIQLAEETDAEVTLSYRQPEFGKAREANKRRFRELAREGRVVARMASNVKEVRPESAVLEQGGALQELGNDFVLACLGGELPAQFLKAVGVSMTRLHGENPSARAGRGSARKAAEDRAHRRLAVWLFALGATVVVTLAAVGWDYYRLPHAERAGHAAHEWLRPAGPWGHGVGVVATLVMMSNFLYAVRKRWGALKGYSTIRTWLTFHQFVGFLSPVVIAFHAAFQSRNQLATLTAASLSVVVLTGVVGRFIYALVPGSDGRATEREDLARRWERLSGRLSHEAATLPHGNEAEALLATAMVTPPQRSVLGFLFHVPRQRLSDARALRRLRPLFPSDVHAREFADAFGKLRQMQGQVAFYQSLKRLLAGWRVFHVVLAVLLVLLISAHIGVSLFLGYRWIFQ
ncbi:MAG: hypothetical protein RL653_3078 [Pseudomonadota bacterium]|jgi:thioredoxin reductase/NAD-dependent dihydropyrimidine dehydrogenase PreA subunit